MTYRLVEAGEFMARRNRSVNPAKFPDEEFELHSIPAFDAGQPEMLSGREIGSSKQIVLPNDVMISKIVPHIRRSSVVGPATGRRQIASSEWIVFRTEDLFPNYLRHLLVSDEFNAKFMRTVSGVGGSLLRARPAEVAKIKIPIPPLSEQRRIAAILDKADALRAKRREAIAKLDQLLQSVFLDMFGHPLSNERVWPLARIADVCSPKQWPTITGKQLEPSGYPVYGANGVIGFYSSFNHDIPTVLVTCRGATCGTINVCEARSYVTGNAMALNDLDSTKVELDYMATMLRMRGVSEAITGAAQPQITREKLSPVLIPLPPLSEQTRFSQISKAIADRRAALKEHANGLDRLFSSTQQHAFSSTL